MGLNTKRGTSFKRLAKRAKGYPNWKRFPTYKLEEIERNGGVSDCGIAYDTDPEGLREELERRRDKASQDAAHKALKDLELRELADLLPQGGKVCRRCGTAHSTEALESGKAWGKRPSGAWQPYCRPCMSKAASLSRKLKQVFG
jgi:hypothetical protein